jgi:hypothetical protein
MDTGERKHADARAMASSLFVPVGLSPQSGDSATQAVRDRWGAIMVDRGLGVSILPDLAPPCPEGLSLAKLPLPDAALLPGASASSGPGFRFAFAWWGHSWSRQKWCARGEPYGRLSVQE